MARKKTTKAMAVIAPQTVAEADQYLRDIGKLNILITDIDTDLRESTAKLKQEAEDQAAPHRLDVEKKWLGLQSWAQANRESMTKGSKTIRLPSGSISWRILPPKVSLKGVDDIVALLKSTAKWKKFLRIGVAVDKEAMLRDKVEAAKITGVTIASEGEAIDYEVDETKLNPS